MYSEQSLPLSLKTKTWSRDSHGLYDYQSRSLITKIFPISTPGTLLIHDSDTQFHSQPFHLRPNLQTLAYFTQSNGYYSISSSGSDSLWKIIKYIQTQSGRGYQLSTGDILKLGRIKLQVKQLVCDDFFSNQEKPQNLPFYGQFQDKREQICRICYCEQEQEDPLISPCHCLGSLQYIHLKCFINWLEKKVSIKEGENSITYFWQGMVCELCKQPYTYSQLVKGREIEFFKSMSPIKPYVVMESLTGNQKSLYIISLINKFQAKVGRGHDSEIRISDISVSRFHATLSYKQGRFSLEDNNSKFGSLVQVSSPIAIKSKSYLQIGRTLIVVKPNN